MCENFYCLNSKSSTGEVSESLARNRNTGKEKKENTQQKLKLHIPSYKKSPSRSPTTSPSLQVRLRKKTTKPSTSKMRPKSLVVMSNTKVRRSSNAPESNALCLLDALHDKKIKIGFRKFLESEFSVENLDFWIAVEEYKSIKNKELRQAKAQEIYEEYVSPGSPSQINLDFYTTRQVMQNMALDTVPCVGLFNGAQKYVFNIMENDSYARFVRSKCYDICSSSGRRSPRKFFHDILYVTSRGRDRSLSPTKKQDCTEDVMMNNSNNNKIILHRSDSNLDKNSEERRYSDQESSLSTLHPCQGVTLTKKLAKSDTNLAKSVPDHRSIRSFFARLRSK